LIQGESGTGKELIARAIHDNGPLAARPFVSVNCGALAAELVESLLFGHVAGAFTGAIAAQPGLIRQADGGTLFLDEIGDLPAAIQAKFLRVLEDGEVRPLGSEAVYRVNVRLISASHRNLEAMIASGAFRSDLFYRINVLAIDVPPLRSRRDDFPALVSHFLAEVSREAGKPRRRLTKRALRLLMEAPWPGNIRQLQNVIAMMVALSESRTLDVRDLPPEMQRGQPKSARILTLEEAKEKFYGEYVRRLLAISGGKVSACAKIAGIHRKNVWEMLRKYKV
jgi:two-component system response regulator GlrR